MEGSGIAVHETDCVVVEYPAAAEAVVVKSTPLAAAVSARKNSKPAVTDVPYAVEAGIVKTACHMVPVQRT